MSGSSRKIEGGIQHARALQDDPRQDGLVANHWRSALDGYTGLEYSNPDL